SKNEDGAHHQCPKNPPEEDGMLVARWHLEVREDQHKDEDVIDTERLLDQVTGQELERWLWPIPGRHAYSEEEGQSDPATTTDTRFFERDLVCAAMQDPEVHGKHHQYEYIEGYPHPHLA